MRYGLFAILLVSAGAFAADPTREITGQVVDAQTGAPIPRARVTVTFFAPNNEQAPVQLLTDETGGFDLRNAPAHPYQVMGQRAGYLQNVPPEKVKTASGPDNTGTERWIVRLAAQVVIEGVVVDEKGAPVPFATVQVYRQSVVEGRRVPQQVSGNPADDEGNFRIFGLRADRYQVGVTVPPRPQLSKFTYTPVFYPSSPDLRSAEVMDLKSGDERRLRIRLPDPVTAHEIRGTVVNGGDGVGIQLKLADPSLAGQPLNELCSWDPKTHEFRIPGVAPGSYLVEAMANSANQMASDSQPVVVGDRDLTGIRLDLRLATPITGTVRFAGEDKPAGLVPQIEFRSGRGRFGAEMDADGRFKVTGLLPDTYRVVSGGMGPVYVQSAWQGGRDVLQKGLLVSPNPSSDPLEIELGGPGGTVEGSVPDPTQPVMVALLRRVGNEMVLAKEWIGTGQFRIQGVAPGDYRVFCWPAQAEVAYAEPEFLQQYGTMGKEISVKGPETIHVELDRVMK